MCGTSALSFSPLCPPSWCVLHVFFFGTAQRRCYALSMVPVHVRTACPTLHLVTDTTRVTFPLAPSPFSKLAAVFLVCGLRDPHGICVGYVEAQIIGDVE